MPRLDLVTGAFGFTGRHIAQRLLARGVRVRTLSNQTPSAPLAERVETHRYAFDDAMALARAFEGVDTFYNTYWVRFDWADRSYVRAVDNTRRLFEAARWAGVRRIVHVSIANPSLDSPLPYYRGKARVERALAASNISHAILRPTVLFGDQAILLNNIAWLLRHLPLFGIPGDGSYRLQPVHVGDLADLAVEHAGAEGDVVLDVAGPEVYAYRDLVLAIRRAIDSRSLLVNIPSRPAFAAARVIGWLMRDVLITRDELIGLRTNLLESQEPARGTRALSEWIERHGQGLGRQYLSELGLHYRERAPGHAS